MIDFNQPYRRENFLQFLEVSFLPDDFKLKQEIVAIPFQTKYFKSVTLLGETDHLGLAVYEVRHSSENDARVGLTREMFRLMAAYGKRRSLVLLVPENGNTYRFSLVTIDLKFLEDKVKRTFSNPKRYSFILGENAKLHTPQKFLIAQGKVTTFEDLQKRFSVEVLTKEFYGELFAWYQWALSDEIGVTFPNDRSIESDDRKIEEHLIRLITRLMFVWFIKQKKLVPEEIFEVEKLKTTLKNFQATDSKQDNFYRAILQNLFFATLNNKIEERTFAVDGNFQENRVQYGIKTLFRYADDFSVTREQVIQIFSKVPFLNGGLFECLDKDTPDSNGKIVYSDGFSRKIGRQSRAFIPNILFFEPEKGILSILNKYNFTIEENSPLDVEVALDPELLGKVFENLLGTYNPETKETARKQSGSFYTPREIVQYMVDESLVEHLKRTVGDEFEAEYRKLIDQTDEPITLTDQQKSEVFRSLKVCKILDPACGSGAFPMGILNRMLAIIAKLPIPASISTYDLKLHLIENCIYGIDIQSIAVQISKLRFFISLICEQQPNSDSADNYGIKPLPNLETKFVAANTLIGLTPQNAQRNLFEDPLIEVTRNELIQIRHKHFLANTARHKKECRDEDKKLREKLAKLLDNNGNFAPDDARQLANWNPYDQNASSPFFDTDWMFGIKNGFDVVIGNPPYLRIQGIREADSDFANTLTKLYISASGSFDLYAIFVEKALSLIYKEGIVNFIMPVKWSNAAFGKGLRSVVSKQSAAYKMINFGAYQVFNASTYTGLQWFKPNSEKLQYTELNRDLETNQELGKYLNSLTSQNFSHINSEKLTAESWVLTVGDTTTLLNKLNEQPRRIKDIFDKIFQGLATSKDDVYFLYKCHEEEGVVIGFSKYLDREVKIERDLVKPLLKGDDVHRYDNISTERFVIFPYKLENGKANLYTESEIETHFPNGYTYLKACENVLRYRENERFNIDGEWFQFGRKQGILSAECKKLVAPDISMGGNFAYDEKGEFYQTTTIYGYIKKPNVVESYKFWVALLNSSLCWWFLVNTGTTLANGYFRFKPDYINPFPVPAEPITEIEIRIVEIVDKIMGLKQANPKADTQQLETRIDLMVFKLYELTYDEAMIVDPELGKIISREEYEKAGVEELAEWEYI